MITRLFLAFAVLTAALVGEAGAADVKTGDLAIIHMTGDMAAKYGVQIGAVKPDDVSPQLEIETIAQITGVLDNGEVFIKSELPLNREGEPERLVTLTTKVAADQLRTVVDLEDTKALAAPGATNHRTTSTPSPVPTNIHRVSLTGFQGVKIRVWKLAEEIGE